MIVLFTDFGVDGPYTGQVLARLQCLAPDVPAINLFSDLQPFDIQSAAYLLPAYCGGFPAGSVFICVVDPGVGGDRPGVIVHADDHWFVGPNEGLFSLLARRAHKLQCRQLPVAAGLPHSFHGRDVFAPVAAQLALGESVTADVTEASHLERPDWPDDLFRVVYIDRYGNAITGVRATTLERSAVLAVNGRLLPSARTFSEVAPGEAFWYENSNGLVGLAVNQGRADEVLAVGVGAVFACKVE